MVKKVRGTQSLEDKLFPIKTGLDDFDIINIPYDILKKNDFSNDTIFKK